jgi:group I intron endonuclease
MINGGIYQIRNLINNKRYIGSTVNIDKRWYEHKKSLRKNIHVNEYLQNAWNKYGEDNFDFDILEQVENKVLLLEREQYWMDYYKSYKRNIGYNICSICGNVLGCRWNLREETKIKLSEMRKGRKLSEESKKRIGEKAKERFRNKENHPMFGKHLSEEQKQKLRESHLGLKHSEETKQKMKEIFSGEGNPFFGKHHSRDSNEKNRIFHAKLTWQQVNEIREKYKTGLYTHENLSKEYGITRRSIGRIINNERWKE